MRIGLVTSVRRKVGGIESYLELLAGGLLRAGHQVALWHDQEGPMHRPPIALPASVPSWCAGDLGDFMALAGLRAWQPDVLFSHGIDRAGVEEALFDVAPSVMFAHAYASTCISGAKSRLSPTRAPCSRPLGWPCLLHYLPRRCGGLSPVTMARQYVLARDRRDLLERYQAVVTASPHMRAEYIRNGVRPERAHAIDLFVPPAIDVELRVARPGKRTSPASPMTFNGSSSLASTWRLFFIARLYDLKGGHLLLRAIPELRRVHSGRIEVTIAGDGPARSALEDEARSIARRVPGATIEFPGWLDERQRQAQIAASDLLVVPSVWPEPFGLVGPECGLLGLPAAAFDVGGIPTWLVDGVSGHLAPGDRPTSRGLAKAIAACLSDPAHHLALRAGAREVASRFTLERHFQQLIPILATAASSRSEQAAKL